MFIRVSQIKRTCRGTNRCSANGDVGTRRCQTAPIEGTGIFIPVQNKAMQKPTTITEAIQKPTTRTESVDGENPVPVTRTGGTHMQETGTTGTGCASAATATLTRPKTENSRLRAAKLTGPGTRTRTKPERLRTAEPAGHGTNTRTITAARRNVDTEASRRDSRPVARSPSHWPVIKRRRGSFPQRLTEE